MSTDDCPDASPPSAAAPDPRRASEVFRAPLLGAAGVALTAAEREFFMAHGFLVKPRLIGDDLLEPAMDRLWAHLLAAVPVRAGSRWRLRREVRETWVDPQWATMPPHPSSGPHEGRQPVEYYGRIVKLHDIGDQDFLLDLLPRHPQVLAVAHAMLAPRLRPMMRMRGVYPVFPTRDPDDPGGTQRIRGQALGPHTDEVCQQLNVCLYLQDVGPRNGGFTVYPGSHARIYAAHAHAANYSPLPTYPATVRAVLEDTTPLELVAPRGSVIFWHGRLLHSAGIHVGDDIRWAAFADFTQDRPVLGDDEHRALGQYEWFKDAKRFRDDDPVGPDMWAQWRLRAVH